MGSPEPIGKLMREMVYCDHADAVLSWTTDAGGRKITLWCPGCRRHVAHQKGYPGVWIPRDHPTLLGIDLDRLPEAPTTLRNVQCEGPCRRFSDCQYHHWAPRFLFGDSADEWPLARLCKSCHDTWHSMVTPGLCTTFDVVKFAAFLLDLLGVDRSARLTHELIKQGKARREAA